MKSIFIAGSAASFLSIGVATSPAVAPHAIGNPYTSQLAAIKSSVQAGTLNTPDAASAFGALLASATPTVMPKNYQEFQSSMTQIFGTQASQASQFGDILNASLSMLANGAGGLDGLQNYLPLGSVCPGINCDMNTNPAPKCNIYPKKAPSDAPYSLPEEEYRRAIYIPSGFTYGASGKQPVLLVPGTGSYGGVNFQNNFQKILSATPYAEPFWLNIPGAQLADIQLAAEYTAYAMNYMQCQSSRSIAAIGWSQASVNYQWAFKYFPSTRANVTDVIAISGDYHGTTQANLLCAALPCDPAVLQQEYTSKFISTLRSGGGESAYVPTTNVYSALLDEIVQPQVDPVASGATLDARGVGVSNTAVQLACPGQAAGSLYDHAGVLFNPVAVALALDALQHDGPGELSRVDLKSVCGKYVADGLVFEDALLTEGLIPLAGYYLITYLPKNFTEPTIRDYAM